MQKYKLFINIKNIYIYTPYSFNISKLHTTERCIQLVKKPQQNVSIFPNDNDTYIYILLYFTI